MIKDIVFDFGGVLVDLAPEEAIRRLISLGIHDAAELLDPYLQKGIFRLLEDGTLSTNAFEQRLEEIYYRHFRHEDLLWAIGGFIKEVPAYKLNYIDSLRSTARVSVLSNTNPYILEHIYSKEFFNGKAITDLVDKVYASCEMRLLKPSADIYLSMLHKGGMKASETLFLDDSQANVEAAKKVEINSLLVQNGEDWKKRIEEAIFSEANK